MAEWLLVASASAFWAGIVLAGLGQPAPDAVERGVVLILVGAVTSVWGAMALRGNGRRAGAWSIAWAVVSFGLLGAGWASLREGQVRESPLARLVGRAVVLQGVIASVPEAGNFGWTTSMRAEVVVPDATDPTRGVKVHESLWVEGRGPAPQLEPGDRVAVTGLLEALRGDFGTYLRHRGYPATLFAEDIEARGRAGGPFERAARGLRGTLGRSLLRVLPTQEAGLMMGLTLGDTSRLDPDIEQNFRATGLSHLTAVSGENLAMFLGPILGVAVWLRAGRRVRFALGACAVGFFVLLTGAEPSVLRAAAMSGLTLLGVFLGRPRSPPAIVGGAVLALLAINPTLVYSIGFQLSVAATTGMAMLSAPVAARLRFLPEGLALAAGTTLGAQLGVLPLLLYHFGIVPTVSVPANLLAFPAVGPAMLLGLVAAGAGLFFRPLGLMIASLARLPLGYLETLAARLSRSPLPSITSETGRLLILFGGIAVVVAVAWWIHDRRRLPRRLSVAAALFLPFLVWSSALRAGSPGSLTVVFFDVGQGDSALVRSPGGAAILIDGGPDHEQVATKLASLRIRRLDLVVATHAHEDHVAGLPEVLGRFAVALVIDPGCQGDSPFYAEFLHAVDASGVPFRHPPPGTVIAIGDVRLDVLGPERCFVGTDSDPNNDSLVLRLREGDASILFPGDAEEPSQTDLLHDSAGLLRSVVLKVPHHGGDTSLDQFFLAVRATVAIVSVGPNRYGHPVPDVLEELARDGMRVFRTDVMGDVTVTLEGEEVLVSGGG
jgi:competence protein ComEC